jgi:Caspase domain
MVNGDEDRGQRRALVISISQYDKLEPLDFCEKDGNKMYEVLKQLEYDIPQV